MSAVIVNDARESIARAELATVKRTLGRKPSDVLHFRNLTHSQKVKACQEVANFSIERVASVILCKRSIQQPFPGGGLAYISQPDPMYLWAIRLLLERISWHLRDTGGGSSIVTFAHLSRFKAAKLHDYRQASGSLRRPSIGRRSTVTSFASIIPTRSTSCNSPTVARRRSIAPSSRTSSATSKRDT